MMLTSTQIGELAAQFFIAGAGTLSFAILFGCPRKSLPFCGLVGAVGWFVYELAVLLGMGARCGTVTPPPLPCWRSSRSPCSPGCLPSYSKCR